MVYYPSIVSIEFDAIISNMVNQRKDWGAFKGIMEIDFNCTMNSVIELLFKRVVLKQLFRPLLKNIYKR